MEEKSCLFGEISGIAVLVPIMLKPESNNFLMTMLLPVTMMICPQRCFSHIIMDVWVKKYR